MTYSNPTCAVLLIGNELLSGRTEDANLNYIAKKMSANGIRLKECRVVEDDFNDIIPALNELRQKYTYVFTTGGIGPTHDDITVEAIARTFGVSVYRDENVVKNFYEHYGDKVNENMLKMACFPEGACLIKNKISVAPGFAKENVYSFAGIPVVMQSMLDAVIPSLEKGKGVISKSIHSLARESLISDAFEEIQNEHSDLDLGSYPAVNSKEGGTTLVVSGTDEADVKIAFEKVVSMIKEMNIEIIEIVG